MHEGLREKCDKRMEHKTIYGHKYDEKEQILDHTEIMSQCCRCGRTKQRQGLPLQKRELQLLQESRPHLGRLASRKSSRMQATQRSGITTHCPTTATNRCKPHYSPNTISRAGPVKVDQQMPEFFVWAYWTATNSNQGRVRVPYCRHAQTYITPFSDKNYQQSFVLCLFFLNTTCQY